MTKYKLEEWIEKHRQAHTPEIEEMNEQLENALDNMQEALAVISQLLYTCTEATVDENTQAITAVFTPIPLSEWKAKDANVEV